MAFDSTAFVTLTLAPNSTDDFPPKIGETIDAIARRLGFHDIMLVDAHNSHSNQPITVERTDLIGAAEELLKKLREAQQSPLRIGFAHSKEFDFSPEQDLGPAGISVVVFEIERKRYVLIGIDANNLISGFREQIINQLSNERTSVIEICTSDTHVTAGKIRSQKGYLALGEITGINILVETLQKMVEKAGERLSPAESTIRNIETKVRTVGANVLRDYAKGIEIVIQKSKRGGQALLLLSAFILSFAVLDSTGILTLI